MSVRNIKFGLIILWLGIVLYRLFGLTQLTNGVYHPIDPHSDANCVRAGLSYFDEGFGKFYGLPDMIYNREHANSAGRITYIYTHYPDGGELLTGVSYYIWGDKDERLLRILPFTVHAIAILVFFFALFKFFGDGRALGLAIFLSILPMFSNMMSNLAYHPYAFSLMLFQLSLGLSFYKRRVSDVKFLGLTCLLAFLHGLFCLDYFFVATLASLVFFVWREGFKINRQSMLLGLVPALSFFLAFSLHFWQVVAYQTWEGAINDYAASGKYRLYGEGSTLDWVHLEDLTPWNVLRVQIDIFISKKENYHMPIQFIILLIGLASLFYKRSRHFVIAGRKFEWAPTQRDALAIGVAIVVGTLWTVSMLHHSIIHFFIARHFFVPFLLCLLVLLTRLKVIR